MISLFNPRHRLKTPSRAKFTQPKKVSRTIRLILADIYVEGTYNILKHVRDVRRQTILERLTVDVLLESMLEDLVI